VELASGVGDVVIGGGETPRTWPQTRVGDTDEAHARAPATPLTAAISGASMRAKREIAAWR